MLKYNLLVVIFCLSIASGCGKAAESAGITNIAAEEKEALTIVNGKQALL